MRSGLRLAAVFLAVICLGAAAFLGWKILQTEHEYRAGISAYDRLAEIAGGTDGTGRESREGPGEIPASVGSGEAASSDGSQTNEPDEDFEEDSNGSGSGFHGNPEVWSGSEDQSLADLSKPADLPDINFKALQEMNPDVIGWIYSPDTTINYPVVQGDDNAYYLKHLADGTENRNGCPFLDVQNRPDFTDDNSIIYGHHMQNGTMFAGISWYEGQSYYDEHPVMYLITPSATYRIELYSGYITTMDSSAYMQNFGSVREHTDWLKKVSGRSDFRANLEISAYDRVITLSTCAYRFENARYVLHGKLVKLR
ncbi:MAG: class B sortase [Lachnospiraceae bacterium]|nr:class B sortase [Lachnospiraceae bacterium]